MKKVVSVLLSVLIIFSLTLNISAKDTSLKFSDDGDFKILVLSDTQDDQYPAYDMLNCVKKSIEEAQPDLIVFTGDLVEDSRIGDIGIDDEPFREGVLVEDIKGNINYEQTLKNVKKASDAILSIFQDSGVPFAIAQGNNDYKSGISNEDWLKIYSQYSNCLIVDESDDADNRIDYSLKIKNHQGNIAFNIWMIDSGRGSVREDQIEWYKKESAKITAANGGTPVPAIVFQHVQTCDIGNLFEECNMWDEGATAKGTKFYRLKPDTAHGYNLFAYEPGYTSDEFLAWKECGDVIGAFFGHQHVEGFSGIYDGIELGFTYGSEFAKLGPYGYRLITLHENDVKNYDNDLYTYEGSVLLNNAHFEKQIDSPYTVYDNSVLEFFGYIKNFLCSCVSFVVSWFG